MKKNIIILISLFVLLVIMGTFFVGFYEVPSLLKTSFTFEYGKEVKITSKDVFGDTKDVPDDVHIDLSSLVMEKDKKYPKLGSYSLRLTYQAGFKEKTEEISVRIIDTTQPEFTKVTNEIRIPEGKKDHDFSSDFEVQDLNQPKLSFNLDEVDFDTPGTYSAIAFATDGSNNKREHSFDVIIENTEGKEAAANEIAAEQPSPSESDGGSEVSPPTTPSTDSPYYVNGILVVNKRHGLSSSYAPGENAEAKTHLMQMLQEMLNQGLSISTSYSGYRDYEYQRSLYENYVASHGQESADTFSARPGFSEHQTGLAFDLIQPDGNLLESAAETQWVAAHAHEYGFIVRYQSGKESITGYMAEPWHVRYVGSQAQAIYQSGLTLEEYLGVTGGTSY